MIFEKLHFVRTGRPRRPATLKLAAAATALFALAAPQAHAQFDRGQGYTSEDTPKAQAQKAAAQNALLQSGKTPEQNTLSAPIPELQVFTAVDLAEVYTSDAAGTVGNGDKSDFFTRPRLNLSVREQSSRLVASVDYTLTGEYYARNHDLDQITNHLNALANAELIPEWLYFDTTALATPLSLSRVGAITADGSPTSTTNTRSTYGYMARPTVLHKWGDVVETDLWAAQSGEYFIKPTGAIVTPLPDFFIPPSNSNSSSLGARIASLTDFFRLRWSANATATDTYQSNSNSQKERSALANVSYNFTNELAAIFTGGYQTYHSSFLLAKKLDGPTLLGGIQVITGPNFHFFAQAGTQNNFPTYIGSLAWLLDPLTSICANSTDEVKTPQERLLGNTQATADQAQTGLLSTSQNSECVDPGATSALPTAGASAESDATPDESLALENSLLRYRSYEALFRRVSERMHYTLKIYDTIEDRLNIEPQLNISTRSTLYGVQASVERDLRHDLMGTISFDASKAQEFGGNDRILRGMFDLRYNATQTLSFYFETSVLNRQSEGLVAGLQNGGLIDTRVTVGVNKAF